MRSVGGEALYGGLVTGDIVMWSIHDQHMEVSSITLAKTANNTVRIQVDASEVLIGHSAEVTSLPEP